MSSVIPIRRFTNDESNRPSWPEIWMKVAETISTRSYDPRLRVGTIIVSDDNTQVLSVGYNGNYKGGPHEHESNEPGQSGFIHSEINALVKCDYNFSKRKHLYVTHSPCPACSKLIINAEIVRVVYKNEYRDKSGLAMMRSVGIEVFDLDSAILMAKQGR
jgi:dCMP deaminase